MSWEDPSRILPGPGLADGHEAEGRPGPGRDFHVRPAAEADGGRLRVEVPGTRAERRPAVAAPHGTDAQSEPGRGLLLVTALARESETPPSHGARVRSTQNSLPSGSAMTTQLRSWCLPPSVLVAPRASSLATSSSVPRSIGLTSR